MFKFISSHLTQLSTILPYMANTSLATCYDSNEMIIILNCSHNHCIISLPNMVIIYTLQMYGHVANYIY